MRISINNNKYFQNVVGQFPQVRSYIFLVPTLSYNNIFKREMLTSIIKVAKKGGEQVSKIVVTQVTTNNNNSLRTPSKPYATTNVCEPDKNATDPQAVVNNPGVPFQHKEIQRGTCPQPNCKEQDCGPLLPGTTIASCNNDVTTVESVGHATSGNLNIPTGKTIPLDTNVNMVGQSKQQNFFVYNTPHSTGITPEAFPTPGKSRGKGTDFLHDPNHPHRVAAVIEETKNK